MAVVLLPSLVAAPPIAAETTPPRAARTGAERGVSRKPSLQRPSTASRKGTRPKTSAPPRIAPSEVVGRRIRHAMQLAARGAIYAAEEEFLKTLQLMANRCDEHARNQRHSDALAAGLLALKEADAFVFALDDQAASRNVRPLIAAHSSPLLKNSTKNAVPALQALQVYYDYAQARLHFAVQLDPYATDVFYGLAKVSMVQAGSEDEAASIAQAIAFLQLALDADPKNFRAANELGVLLARCGRWKQAKHVLRHGLSVRQEPEILLNLSKVHARLGESDLAARAHRQYQRVSRLSSEKRTTDIASIRWVDKSTFSEGFDEAELISKTPQHQQLSNEKPRTAEVAKTSEPTKKRKSTLTKLKSLFRLDRQSPESDVTQATRHISRQVGRQIRHAGLSENDQSH